MSLWSCCLWLVGCHKIKMWHRGSKQTLFVPVTNQFTHVGILRFTQHWNSGFQNQEICPCWKEPRFHVVLSYRQETACYCLDPFKMECRSRILLGRNTGINIQWFLSRASHPEEGGVFDKEFLTHHYVRSIKTLSGVTWTDGPSIFDKCNNNGSYIWS